MITRITKFDQGFKGVAFCWSSKEIEECCCEEERDGSSTAIGSRDICYLFRLVVASCNAMQDRNMEIEINVVTRTPIMSCGIYDFTHTKGPGVVRLRWFGKVVRFGWLEQWKFDWSCKSSVRVVAFIVVVIVKKVFVLKNSINSEIKMLNYQRGRLYKINKQQFNITHIIY